MCKGDVKIKRSDSLRNNTEANFNFMFPCIIV